MSYNAQIERLGLFAVVDLKGTQDALKNWIGQNLPEFPATPNSGTARDGLELYWIGADHWLLRAPLDREAKLIETLGISTAPADISAVLISDTLCFYSVRGPDSGQIMAIATPLDVSLQSLTGNGATYSEAFGLKALIICRPGGYELAVERSYGDMTEDCFTRINGA
jgi:sarcosine oxidase subunit gamma